MRSLFLFVAVVGCNDRALPLSSTAPIADLARPASVDLAPLDPVLPDLAVAPSCVAGGKVCFDFHHCCASDGDCCQRVCGVADDGVLRCFYD